MSDWNQKHNRAVWFDIPVNDLDRSVSFYREVLGIEVVKQEFEGFRFAVLAHEEGNGGCLVERKEEISSDGGILLYMNTEGRIRDAAAKVEANGGKILEPVHAIGPHGFRALVLDSEGNRIALHSSVDA